MLVLSMNDMLISQHQCVLWPRTLSENFPEKVIFKAETVFLEHGKGRKTEMTIWLLLKSLGARLPDCGYIFLYDRVSCMGFV